MKNFKRTKNNPTIGMTKEEVTKYWIEKGVEKFGNNFDYSEVGIINIKKDPCIIICKEHGRLETSFYNHLGSGTGCPHCGEKECRKSKTFTLEDFNNKLDLKYPNRSWKVVGDYKHNKIPVLIEDEDGLLHLITPNILLNSSSSPCVRTAKDKKEYCINRFRKIHKDKLTFEKFEYLGTKTKSTITCKIHGDFEMCPNELNNGRSCPKCGKENIANALRSNIEEFINKANKVHGEGTYDYSKSLYLSAVKKLEIICNIEGHGSFWQKPNGHLDGNGCPTCGRENGGYGKNDYIKQAKGRESILYIIKAFKDDEVFYKIGITFQGLKLRFSKRYLSEYKYETIYEYKCDAGCVWDLEKELHKKYKHLQHIPYIYFQGYTECFTLDLPVEEIISYLNSF